MTRECHVRFCERLRGQFLWPTHHASLMADKKETAVVGEAAKR